MHMQITSSDKIHNNPLKFEILDVATKTVNAIPSQYLLNVDPLMKRILLFICYCIFRIFRFSAFVF